MRSLSLLISLATMLTNSALSQQASRQNLKFPESIAKNELVGYVLDDKGQPLEGVTVDAWSWYKGNETTTDKNGFFRLKNLDQDQKVEVRFSKPDYSPHYIVQQSIGQPGFVVELDSLTYIEGTVTGPDGEPVANAVIQGDQGPNQGDGVLIGHVRTETKSDAQGKYRLYCHPGQYEVKVSVPDVGVAHLVDILVEKTEAELLDISLAEGVTFKARVIESVTGKPFEGLVLWHWHTPTLKGVSDAAGNIEIPDLLPGKQEFDFGFGESRKFNQFTIYDKGPIGRWWSDSALNEWERKSTEENGWQRNFDGMTFELLPDMDVVEIVVEIGAQVTGHVYDPDGKPIGGATVAPAKTGSGNSITGDTRYSTETKEDGSYEVVLPASNDFEYNLVVQDGKYQQFRNFAGTVSQPFKTTPGQKVVDLDFTLNPPATIRGKIIGRGDLEGKEVRAVNTDMLDNRYYVPTAKTQKDGTFEIRCVRPGETMVQVEPFWLDPRQAPDASNKIVDVKEGGTIEGIELNFTAGQ